jgi:hypothetical protein
MEKQIGKIDGVKYVYPAMKTKNISSPDLYATLILPHEPELLRTFLRIRQTVDEIMLGAQAEIWYENPHVTHEDFLQKDASQLFGYPDGCCLAIVDNTLAILGETLETEAPYLAEYLQLGGTLRRDWGYYEAADGRKILQNFIRIGDRVWDVAYEEMEPGERRKVAVTPDSENRYRNFESLEDMFRTTEAYYPGTKYFASVPLVGWVGAFHPGLCFHESTGYLLQTGENNGFPFGEVEKYLYSAEATEFSEDRERRLIQAVTNLLAFESDGFQQVEILFLRCILGHLQKPVRSRKGLETQLEFAREFAQEQAGCIGESFEETFSELSDIARDVMGKVSDEYYDRLIVERKAAKTLK